MSVTDRPAGDVVVIDVKGEMINNKEYGSVKRRVGELLRVTKMLAISKLDTAIEVFATEAEALHSFDPAPQA